MKPQRIPLQVWILTLSAFAIGTAEFVVAGLLTTMANALNITDGQAGNVITAYAMAIVVGGPVLTLWLARFEKRNVLAGLMVLFITANLVSALATSYPVLLASRVLAGLVQGPFYGIRAVVATRLVAGNHIGGITADRNLRQAQILWPVLMVVSLIVVGLASSHYWLFMVATFLFGIASFGNVPPLQMNVMKHRSKAQELAGTANISAFNLANALGGIIGGLTVDSAVGAAGIPWVATLIPLAGIAYVLFSRRKTHLNVQALR